MHCKECGKLCPEPKRGNRLYQSGAQRKFCTKKCCDTFHSKKQRPRRKAVYSNFAFGERKF